MLIPLDSLGFETFFLGFSFNLNQQPHDDSEDNQVDRWAPHGIAPATLSSSSKEESGEEAVGEQESNIDSS